VLSLQKDFAQGAGAALSLSKWGEVHLTKFDKSSIMRFNISSETALYIKQILIPLIAFFAALSLHLFLSVSETASSIRSLGPSAEFSWLNFYMSSLLCYTGYSLGLGAMFIADSILKFARYREIAGKVIIKGVAISGVIFFVLSFALGFYSVSIEEYYLNKMGWFYVSIKKMLALPVTIISIIPGYLLIFFRLRKASPLSPTRGRHASSNPGS
jgi:hypothetical protein